MTYGATTKKTRDKSQHDSQHSQLHQRGSSIKVTHKAEKITRL